MIELVKQKGVYPYEYMGSFEKFSENKLPDKSKFFSFVKNKCISGKKYLHAVDVWDAFKIQWVIIMILI